jgi:U2 small nuclear ribonucleoprotein A'
MRLTVELIEGAAQYIHPATRDREIDLRGYKIGVIENMGATLDQFDSIDLSDNEIKKLDGLPLLKRVKKVLLNNNKVTKIADNLEEALPSLEWLILTNNSIQELGDLDSLSKLTNLECLSLLNNPVATKKHYRQYVINKIPTIRLLDFRRVRLSEREEAKRLFKGSKGKELEKQIGVKSNKFTPGEPLGTKGQEITRAGHTAQDVESIKAAISKAQTLEEIERLNQLLKAGFVPGKNDLNRGQAATAGGDGGEEDEMEQVEQIR